jgi:hypothetical protein
MANPTIYKNGLMFNIGVDRYLWVSKDRPEIFNLYVSKNLHDSLLGSRATNKKVLLFTSENAICMKSIINKDWSKRFELCNDVSVVHTITKFKRVMKIERMVEV